MDTWGISEPTFLAVYGGALAGCVAIALTLRLLVLRGGPDRTPSTGEVALLTGGPLRAVHASLAGLRAAGVVDVDVSRELNVTGTVPSGLSTLDQVVYEAARQHRQVTAVGYDRRVLSAVNDVTDELVRARWLLDDAGRARIRLGSWLVLGLGAVGVVRIIADLLNDRPIGYLALLTLATIVIGLALRAVPRLTRAGRRVVARSRRSHRHLAPSQSPAWSTYGAAGAAMSVALYGTMSWWAADPAFAEQAGIRRDVASGSAGSGRDDYSGGPPFAGGCGGVVGAG